MLRSGRLRLSLVGSNGELVACLACSLGSRQSQ